MECIWNENCPRDLLFLRYSSVGSEIFPFFLIFILDFMVQFRSLGFLSQIPTTQVIFSKLLTIVLHKEL